jgi:hypothetical protein
MSLQSSIAADIVAAEVKKKARGDWVACFATLNESVVAYADMQWCRRVDAHEKYGWRHPADDALVKPLTVELLVEVIAKQLLSQQQRASEQAAPDNAVDVDVADVVYEFGNPAYEFGNAFLDNDSAT